MSTRAPAGRIAAAAILTVAGLGVGLMWLSSRRPTAIPVVRCPIHGIAYDTELEMCPDCARTGEAPKGRKP